MTQPQYMDALERANEVRLVRADAKRDLCHGELSLDEALRLDCFQTLLVKDLLQAQRRWGEVRVQAQMERSRIEPGATVGALTEEQCTSLCVDVQPVKPSSGISPSRACRGCGVGLVRRTEEMLCGFCVAEGKAA